MKSRNSAPNSKDTTTVMVYVAGFVKHGKIVAERRNGPTISKQVEFDTAGIPRQWFLEGQCFTRDEVPAFVEALRADAKALSDRADVFEAWLERQAIQGGS